MGYDLCGRKSDFRCDIWQWLACTDLARCFGWIPAGTTSPGPRIWNGDKWGGGYFSNAWQYVEDRDAAGLARGLEAAAAIAFAGGQGATDEQNVALRRLLTADPKWPSSASRAVKTLEAIANQREVPPNRPQIYGVVIKMAWELARFCREGGFNIT